jgi:hypothetical protein
MEPVEPDIDVVHPLRRPSPPLYRRASMTAERAADPETPPQELLGLARRWPEEVLSNPSLPLLALSDPATARAVMNCARCSLLRPRVASLEAELPEAARPRLAEVVVARVLDQLKPSDAPALFEQVSEGLRSLRRCIEQEASPQVWEEERNRYLELRSQNLVGAGFVLWSDAMTAVSVAFLYGGGNRGGGLLMRGLRVPAVRAMATGGCVESAVADELEWQIGAIERLLLEASRAPG